MSLNLIQSVRLSIRWLPAYTSVLSVKTLHRYLSPFLPVIRYCLLASLDSHIWPMCIGILSMNIGELRVITSRSRPCFCVVSSPIARRDSYRSGVFVVFENARQNEEGTIGYDSVLSIASRPPIKPHRSMLGMWNSLVVYNLKIRKKLFGTIRVIGMYFKV